MGFGNIINIKTLPYKSQFHEHCDCIAFLFVMGFIQLGWGEANQKVTTNIWNFDNYNNQTVYYEYIKFVIANQASHEFQQ